MAEVDLHLVGVNSAVVLELKFTFTQQINTDNSYTVVTASGTYVTTGANGIVTTINITGLAPLNVDGSDNKLFIGNGVAVVDLGGVTVTTDGQPAGATYMGSSNLYPGYINIFYTGSTTSLGTSALQPGAFGIDTSPVTYLRLTEEIFIDDFGAATPIDPACFVEGAMIRTPGGDRAVETLRRGDLVVDLDGRPRRVDWIGRRRMVAPFSRPLRSLPVRIRAHALAENVPCRDLLVSPDHAVLMEDVLINAGALVNGVSILRETCAPPAFTYYHLELDEHALIFAENTPTETFIDNVDRMGFDNWAEHETLYPEGKPMRELSLPRAKAARQVPQHIRAALARRANLLFGLARAA